MYFDSHLSVKRVPVQNVDTLEFVSVRLPHRQCILLSFENLNLIQVVSSTPREISLSGDCHTRAPLPELTQPVHF